MSAIAGWGAARLARDIDTQQYDLCVRLFSQLFHNTLLSLKRSHIHTLMLPLLMQVVSPRNHMVFTPMLASVCVGTVEPRSVAVSILNVQPHLKGQVQNTSSLHLPPLYVSLTCISALHVHSKPPLWYGDDVLKM